MPTHGVGKSAFRYIKTALIVKSRVKGRQETRAAFGGSGVSELRKESIAPPTTGGRSSRDETDMFTTLSAFL